MNTYNLRSKSNKNINQNIEPDTWITYQEGVDYYYRNYPEEFYYNYPEFMIKKLNLDKRFLNFIDSDVKNRSREDIRDWMANMDLSIDELNYVGW